MKNLLSIITLLCITTSLRAQETSQVKDAKTVMPPAVANPAATANGPAQAAVDTPSRNENWYTLWGFGFSSAKYADKDQKVLDGLTNVTRTTVNVDVLGFYWPFNTHRTMQGVILNSVSDSFSDSSGRLTLSQSLIAYSVHHFFGQNIGDGWFLRGDIGIAQYSISFSNTSGSYSTTARSESGSGVLLGAGYAWPISMETRFLLTASIASRKVSDYSIGSFNLAASWLF